MRYLLYRLNWFEDVIFAMMFLTAEQQRDLVIAPKCKCSRDAVGYETGFHVLAACSCIASGSLRKSKIPWPWALQKNGQDP